MQSDTKLLHDLHAKEQIREVILTAARAVDRGDKTLLKKLLPFRRAGGARQLFLREGPRLHRSRERAPVRSRWAPCTT